MRKAFPALQTGEYIEMDSGNEDVYIYQRRDELEALVVVLNLSGSGQKLTLDQPLGTVILSNMDEVICNNSRELCMEAYQGIIYTKG